MEASLKLCNAAELSFVSKESLLQEACHKGQKNLYTRKKSSKNPAQIRSIPLYQCLSIISIKDKVNVCGHRYILGQT